LSVLFWFFEHYKRKHVEQNLQQAEEKISQLSSLEKTVVEKEIEIATLKANQSAFEEKISEMFKTLSLEALEKNNQNFLTLAKSVLDRYQEKAGTELEKKNQAIGELVNPLKESLKKLEQDMRSTELQRKGDHEALRQQMHSLSETEKHLRHETANLVKALRSPLVRGRWGEIQLKRVVELSGMVDHCDFFEQEHQIIEEGYVRPDMIVHLPGGRQVVIDSKVPLHAYLEGIETMDESLREEKLKDHARQVRQHVQLLSKKSYWEHFQPSPEFVVLFLPAEAFYSSALEHDPSLIEVGADHKVILATPTILIALLRAVAYGWKQENLSKRAEEVQQLGHELYKRLIDMSEHFIKMGRSLSSSVEHYNKAVGSLESRVLVSARKFKELGAALSHQEIEMIDAIEKIPRTLQAPELQ
jgi:DNA recombination protein RmuC